MDKKKTNKKKLSTLIKQQVPEFVLSDHPKFTEFLTSYFLFMESAELNLDTFTAIDQILLETVGTTDSFVLLNQTNKNGLDANNKLVNIIQIETRLGLESVEEIASIEGVDCLWVGHFDLTNFLDIPGDFKSPIYLDAINRIVSAAKSNNKSLGIMVNNKSELEIYSNLGFNIIAVGTEMKILGDGISNLFN